MPAWLFNEPLELALYETWVRRKQLRIPGYVPAEWLQEALIDELCVYGNHARDFIISEFWCARYDANPGAYGNREDRVDAGLKMWANARAMTRMANTLDQLAGRPCVGVPREVAAMVGEWAGLPGVLAAMVVNYTADSIREDVIAPISSGPGNTTEDLYRRLDGNIYRIRG